MTGRDIAFGAVAIAILYLVVKMFGGKEEPAGPDINDLFELTTPDPLSAALRDGIITGEQVAPLAHGDSAAFIGMSVARLANAPGLLDDDEGTAVSACLMRNYIEQLAFGSTFYKVKGKTVTAFLNEFMNNFDTQRNVEFRQMIARHVLSLRP